MNFWQSLIIGVLVFVVLVWIAERWHGGHKND